MNLLKMKIGIYIAILLLVLMKPYKSLSQEPKITLVNDKEYVLIEVDYIKVHNYLYDYYSTKTNIQEQIILQQNIVINLSLNQCNEFNLALNICEKINSNKDKQIEILKKKKVPYKLLTGSFAVGLIIGLLF